MPTGSSMFMLHFPHHEGACLEEPQQWHDPNVCDITLRRQVVDLALLLEDVFMIHGHGAVTAAHGEEEVDRLADACRRAARRIRPYL
jgi:hypothetical protein